MTNAPTVSQSLAEQIRAFRKRRNMTLNQLAEVCERLGAPQLSFSALANIERGQTAKSTRRRREVSIDELAVLARALQVPPALLLFQVGAATEVELTPGLVVKPWEAVKWWTAEAYLQGDAETYWSIPIFLFRTHDRLIAQLGELLADRLFANRDDAEKARRTQEADLTVQRIRDVRGQMRAEGLIPPEMDADMAFIDQRQHVQMMPSAAEAYLADHPDTSLRPVNYAQPGQGKTFQAGDPTKLGDRLEGARQFAADFVQPATPEDES